MMNASDINTSLLCILKLDTDTNKIVVDSIKIEKNLEVDFYNLLTRFEDDTTTAKEIVQFIASHESLNVLLDKYDYCKSLTGIYEGFKSEINETAGKYSSNFEDIKNKDKKQAAAIQEKKQLLNECKFRVRAYYLNRAYARHFLDEKVLAYSHRRVGWSNPKYPLNESFTIQLKTNFGYGSKSYFYTKMTYKDLDIIPFVDWINYENAKIYEIVNYSSKHFLTDESWYDAMSYVSEACNISSADENLFVEKYIIEQCDEMVRGLKNILTNNSFKLKRHSFLNQDRGYVNLKIDEHNLTEFRGEKISGALGLISYINKFSDVFGINHYVSEIEEFNIEVKPMLIQEQESVKMRLTVLNSDKAIEDTRYNEMCLENGAYHSKLKVIKQELLNNQELSNSKNFKIDAESILEFNLQNPEYEIFFQRVDFHEE